ncbi:hypothetical protein [Sphingomonas sp.]|uniref:hypothetical protein n=1 Tax=Sphingomonas sp. TaxID=28214 RepID=UPI00356A9F40
MATTPPTELPPFPSEPGQPDPVPTELPSPTPDVDFPAPDATPGDEPFQPTDTGLTGDFG